MARLEDGKLLWVHLDSDGHALEVLDADGGQVSFEVSGVYGERLPGLHQGTDWLIDGVHGGEADRARGIVHRGQRHPMLGDGMWLQPEPLLHIGIAGANPGMPLALTGVYSLGNPVRHSDESGLLAPLALAAYAVAEAALTVADIASVGYTGVQYMRGNASAAELTFQVTLTTAGAVSVGGGMAAGVTLGLGKAAGKVANGTRVADNAGDTARAVGAATDASKGVPTSGVKPKVKAKDRRAAEQSQSRRDKHGDEDWEEPASESTAKWKAKEAEKSGGKDARRSGHDAKESGEGDRSRRQLDEDYGE